MARYDLSVSQLNRAEFDTLDQATVDGLWELFIAICDRWKNVPDPDAMRSRFGTFLSNRIEQDPRYLLEYQRAVEVVAELRQEKGRAGAYEFLLTDPGAGANPPNTRLQHARQYVSNEFITLQLSLGAFQAFSGATNYPGYIRGVNGEGPAPYRTFEG
jgi:hypothetical protein